ncbi:MAG TPA: hypothetical protein VHR45_01820 [Thermoanaerobaculia bacterium]|nr:hypothetical protein [Thermoanaerobaculia bacterium]
MPFSRVLVPLVPAGPDALTSAMVGIGMNFAAATARDPNIEDTLLFASLEAMEEDDLRVLAILVTWFGMHAPWVNADRLTKIVAVQESARVRALWSALARWHGKDRRFARLAKIYAGQRLDLLSAGTDFQVRRHGEDPRLAGSALRAPANVLRDRAADVQGPAELARSHQAYRCRVLIGPTYRADMWAALADDPTLSAAALARKTYGSFATAWRVRRDLALLAPPAPLRAARPM